MIERAGGRPPVLDRSAGGPAPVARPEPVAAASPAAALLALCRAYVRGERGSLASSVDSEALLALARRHSLTPILAGMLAGQPVPDVLAPALRRDLERSAARRLALDALVGPFLAALRREGIEAVALKGAVLGALLYRDVAHRPMKDVDLLVAPRDVERALAVAASLGLERLADRHSLAFDLRFGGTAVLTRHPHDLRHPSIDVHWRLIEDWRHGDPTARWGETLARRARPGTVAGEPVLVPSTVDLLVHGAAHLAFHHAFDGLVWHVDLALLVDRLGARTDWEEADALAADLGLATALDLALETTGVLLGVAPPAARPRRGRRWRARAARALALPRITSLAPLGHLEHALPVLLLDSPRAAATTLARGLLPPPEWIRLRYDARIWPLGYVHHTAQALALLAKTFRM